jgi:hypothetical protein
MKNVKWIIVGLAALLVTTLAVADTGYRIRKGSVDQNQWNLERDADGDGIPNGIDEDWVPPQDGTGYQNRPGDYSGNGNQLPKFFSYEWFYNYIWGGSTGTGECDGTGLSRNRRANRK